MTIDFQGGSYDPSIGTFSPKVTFKQNNSAEREFRQHAAWMGLAPDDFGKEFTAMGDRFTIFGVRRRAPRYPIIAKNVRTGKTFVFTAESVVQALGKEKIEEGPRATD